MNSSHGHREFPSYPEATLAIGADPYDFISKTCRRLGSNVFLTRVRLRRTVCMSGEDAARLFYDESRFQRQAAAPGRLQKTLFGKGGVQGLDDEEHRHRKAMFLSLTTRERARDLAETSRHWWGHFAERWTAVDDVVLYDELRELLTRSVCQWAGVPLADDEVEQRTYELTALFEDAGAIGPRHWWGRHVRKRADRWAAGWIERIRSGEYAPPHHSAARVVAEHRDLKGNQLSSHDAAVELLNILRPTVAVAVYLVDVAHALHKHAACLQQVCQGDDTYLEAFANEVRRFYPFFPFVTALVRKDFDWQGYHFFKGWRVILDLYGTNHDPEIWQSPNDFSPLRFREVGECPYRLVPQGGGVAERGHRCPGEAIAVELMKTAAVFLGSRLRYVVPPQQDLQIDRRRLPALPASRFIIRDVELLGESTAT